MPNATLDRAHAAHAELTAIRRDIHAHPEIGMNEHRTADLVARKLEEWGIEVHRGVGVTGVVGVLRNGNGQASVGLRADMDALPIVEETGLPYASHVKSKNAAGQDVGVMHACGHDIHASWTVGAALLLSRDPAAGEVRVVLQPAEEVGEGATAVLASGVLDGVRAIFGAHVDRRFAVGEVVAQDGPLSASTDTFVITLHGEGAHGARPHEAKDPIVGAAELIVALQTIVSRRLDPALPGVVSVGVVQAGRAANVIPESAELSGTLRATTPESRALLTGELERMAHAVASTHRLRADVRFTEGTPPVVNSREATAWAREAARAVLGERALVPLGTSNMGGEDFAFYLERMPGCFLRIGAREAGGEQIAAHSPRFYAAEDALFVGAAVLAQCARRASAALAMR
jgi:hippurate hydrolase